MLGSGCKSVKDVCSYLMLVVVALPWMQERPEWMQDLPERRESGEWYVISQKQEGRV